MYRAVILLLFLMWPVVSPAALPLISPAKDLRYLDQDPEVRQKFLKQREELVKNALQEIRRLLKTAKPADQKILKEASDMLSRLPLLWSKIRTELETQERPLPIDLRQIKGPPYSLKTFEMLLDQDFQLQEEIKALKEKLSFQRREFKRLEDGLEQLYLEYTNLWNKDPRPPKAYLRLAELLTLQARYALAKLELERNSTYQERLANLATDLEKTLQRVFLHLIITSKDLAEIKARLVTLQKKAKALKASLEEERQIVEKALALVNIQLLKAEEKASSSKALFLQKRWELAKERLELELDLLSKREEFLQLKIRRVRFWREWLGCYRRCSRREMVKELKHLKQEYFDFKTALENFERSLEYLSRRLLALQGAISLHAGELKGTKGGEREALSQLLAEEKRFNQEALKTQQFYQEAVQYLKQTRHHLGVVVSLWQIKIGLFGNLLSRLWQTLERVLQKINFFLHYPLWTLRGTTFTVLSLFKALAVLVLGILFLKLLRWRLERLLVDRFNMAPGLVNSLSTLSYYTLLLLVLLVALSTAGINMNQVALIFGALGVGIGFGLQTIANNFISGLIILTERSLKVGDLVELEDGTLGVVKRINIRSTIIQTFDGLDLIVPNAEFISGRVATWTYEDDWRRLRIPFGVAYGSDPEKVKEVVLQAARRVEITEEDDQHPIRVWFKGFGDSSLDFELVVWIRLYHMCPKTSMLSDYYYALYKALNEAGIEIPFPQRDLHLRSIAPKALQDLKNLHQEGENG